MKRSVFLTVVIIILLMVNVGTLIYLWVKKPIQRDIQNDNRKPDASSFLIKELDLTQKQQVQYLELVKEYKNEIRSIRESDRIYHRQFFDLLYGSQPDTIKAKIYADSLGTNKQLEEMATFRHFLRLKSICKDDQMEKFDKVIMEALRIMNPKPPKN